MLSRYIFSKNFKDSLGKGFITTSDASYKIYKGVENGTIDYSTHIIESGERLDYLAGMYYGDSSFWWVIAAASGTGYALQVPPGNVLRVPTNINQIFGVLS